MSNAVVTADRRYTLWLKDFLGRRSRALRSTEHPLADGFCAVEKWLIGREGLSVAERRQSALIEMYARELKRTEGDWRSHARRLKKDLLKASQCASVLFEIGAMALVIRPAVGQVRWSRYQDAAGDIICKEPDLLIECKMIGVAHHPPRDTLAAIDEVLQRVRRARQQRRPAGIPLVVIVGFDGRYAFESSTGLADALRLNIAWFEQHPDVSALLVLTSDPIDVEDTDVLGMRALPFAYGSVTQLVNVAATAPLPKGFTFDKADPLTKRVLSSIESQSPTKNRD